MPSPDFFLGLFVGALAATAFWLCWMYRAMQS